MSNYSSNLHKSTKDNSTQVSHGHLTQEQNLDFMLIDPFNRQIGKSSNNINRSLVSSQHTFKSSNIRRSLKQTEKKHYPESNNPSFFQKKTDTGNMLYKQHQIFQLKKQATFKCLKCDSSQQSPCPLCLGNKMLTKDSALIKFFSYLIQFKFGKIDSYTPSQLPQRSKDIAQRNTIKKQIIRLSVKQSRSECLNIHYNYFCNECGNDQPIRGSRFQCLNCQDYDLCEKCYSKLGHQHLMNQIKESSSYRYSVRCIERASNKQQLINSMKISHFRNRINNIEEKIYSSSLK